MATTDLDQLAEAIAARALSRIRAERVGREDPCSTRRPLPVATGPRECNPGGCAPCDGKESCGPSLAKGAGATRVGTNPADLRTSQDIAGYIDHTLLKPDATRDDIVKLCEEARRFNFATVCVNGANVGLAARLLAGSSAKAIAVVGFPLGAMTPSAKAFEAREAVRSGAAEIDMVINIGALKSRDYRTVLDDIAAVVKASQPAPVKVILETSQLDAEEKVVACVLSKAVGAAFVKTSTGFGGGGATVEDIALMRRVVGAEMGVKASGGVRSADDAHKLIAAGADRLGASASVTIVTGGTSKGAY
jgi:deoxyribose-phosphate aldolase